MEFLPRMHGFDQRILNFDLYAKNHCKLSTVNLQLINTRPQPLSRGEFWEVYYGRLLVLGGELGVGSWEF